MLSGVNQSEWDMTARLSR